jgi:hypothetical protein
MPAATGAASLLTWAGIGLLIVRHEAGPFNDPFLPLVLVGSAVAAGVQVVGAALMLRLRAYAWAAAAAILALIPLSPVWVLGLPFGIWACIVLGRPEVTGGFFGDKRQAGFGPAGGRKLGARVASRFLSLARSFGRYMLPTMPGWKRSADDPRGATPSAIEGRVPGPGGNSSGGSRSND